MAFQATARDTLPDCGGIKAVTDAVRLGASKTEQPGEVPALLRVTGTAPHHCAVSPGLDGRPASYCAWVFPFRSPEARNMFAGLLNRFEKCVPAAELLAEGPAVNHPDSYELKVFQLGRETVSLALKDKGGMAETYLFVRIEAAGE